LIKGHSEYPEKIDAILKAVGVRTLDDVKYLESKLKKSSSDIPRNEQMKVLVAVFSLACG
jgi:hypothetical protein